MNKKKDKHEWLKVKGKSLKGDIDEDEYYDDTYIKIPEPDECDKHVKCHCVCHGQNKVKHVMPCCFMCPKCKQRVRR